MCCLSIRVIRRHSALENGIEHAFALRDAKIEAVMYEAFMTTKPKGLGLGLSLARKYLEGNGGTVSHESGPKGSTFRLVLPKA